jgi:EmrB/QacA subfamily drug resistance transporter
MSSGHSTGYDASRTKRPFVLAAVMLAMFMAAIEATIVATAMPSIVGDLGGFSLLSWVFSVYLLMQAVTIPIYGKLADLFGRKPVFLFGIVVFLAGSILCGFAESMFWLIVFRFIQGVGAGAIQPIATTIVGDIYTLEERAKVQGYLASVWGISSIIGPALGGIFVEYIHWSWVFWVNIPIGILSAIGLIVYLKEDVEKRKREIDYIGSSLLFIIVSGLMVVLVMGGVVWPWSSISMLLFIGGIALASYFFILQERRAAEPMMPLHLWKHRVILVSNLASLTTGAILMGVSTFLPTYVQVLMGYSPTVAGFVLAMMSVGWPLAATIAGRLMIKVGYRIMVFLGAFFLLLGSLVFVFLRPEYGPYMAGMGSFFIGVGMGLATTSFIVSIQSSVEWKVRGVATASNMFMRILGMTIGSSLLGGILNSRMMNYLNQQGTELEIDINLEMTNELLSREKLNELSPEVLEVIQTGLSQSLNSVYIGVLVMAVLTWGVIIFWPKPVKQQAESSRRQ